MRFSSTYLRTGFLSLALILAMCLAPPPSQAADPDPAANAALANYIKYGARLYYLGNRSGLDGWFVVNDRQYQVVYATADGQSLVVGSLWDAQGQNLTDAQTKMLLQNNAEVAAIFGVVIPKAPVAAAAQTVPAAAATPATPSPGEKLLAEFQKAASVTVGSASAPLLNMVMDVNCPHCQATWKNLRDAVFKNTLQVRLIPIATPGSDDERAAAQLLHAADPLNAWDKYAGGDKSQLAGTPDQGLLIAVHANHIMTDAWNINITPYLVYRGKDGKVKIVQGEPDVIDSVLNDIAPPAK